MTIPSPPIEAPSGAVAPDPEAAPAAASPQRVSRLRVFLHDRLAVGSLAFLVIVGIAAALAPIIAPYSPIESVGERLLPPFQNGFVFGTDDQGRDVLSRLIWGAGISLLTGIVPVAISAVLSLVLGLAAGYRDGAFSHLIMRSIDLLFAFPMVLLALSLALALGPGLPVVWVTVICAGTPYLTRVVYAEVRRERHLEYVEAAQMLGARHVEILFKEILPNVLTSLIVYSTTLVGGMIVLSAGLSFLGIGVQPPTADWGRMVSEGAKVLLLGAPHIATISGVTILVVALAFNWIGDALRDVLDPRHIPLKKGPTQR